MSCSGWCWPLIIYVIIVAISFISIFVSGMDNTMKDGGLIWNIVWALIFGFILWILCKNCKDGWAWILLLLPFIIMLIIIAVYILGVSFGTGFQLASVNINNYKMKN
jgi:cell division protein FtsW (lipid II flippase)